MDETLKLYKNCKLYKSQTTKIDINGTIKQAKIRKGVVIGCPLLPYLFNIFIEASTNELKSKTGEIKINVKIIVYNIILHTILRAQNDR